MKPTICIDLDGTLLEYDKFKPFHFGEPKPGALEVCNSLVSQGFDLIVLTARDPAEHGVIAQYLDSRDFPISKVTNVKTPASVYVDDRGLNFSGSWDGMLEVILEFFKEHRVAKRNQDNII